MKYLLWIHSCTFGHVSSLIHSNRTVKVKTTHLRTHFLELLLFLNMH